MHEQTDHVETIRTGDPQVDQALQPLEGLDSLPVHEHATIVDGVHRALQDRLTSEQQPDTADGEG